MRGGMECVGVGISPFQGLAYFPDVRGEARDVLAEVQSEVTVVVEEAFVVELGGALHGDQAALKNNWEMGGNGCCGEVDMWRAGTASSSNKR